MNEGDINNLDVSTGGSNRLRLIIEDGIGRFFVNDEFITTLDVSAKQVAGDIAISTGSNEVDGESTQYEDFTIWEIAQF